MCIRDRWKPSPRLLPPPVWSKSSLRTSCVSCAVARTHSLYSTKLSTTTAHTVRVSSCTETFATARASTQKKQCLYVLYLDQLRTCHSRLWRISATATVSSIIMASANCDSTVLVMRIFTRPRRLAIESSVVRTVLLPTFFASKQITALQFIGVCSIFEEDSKQECEQ